jgi:hypothetical protein
MMGGLEVPDTQQVPMSAPEDWEDVGNDQKEKSERHLRPVLERGLAAVDQGMARAQPIVRSAEETAQQFVKCASPSPSPHACQCLLAVLPPALPHRVVVGRFSPPHLLSRVLRRFESDIKEQPPRCFEVTLTRVQGYFADKKHPPP